MVNRGSIWQRWEPHIHAPGTVLNDQFGDDSWSQYLLIIEGKTPKIEAIGITDYYVTDIYEKILNEKNRGRLPDVKLIFPNVELRLDVAAKTGFVNIHLLVSPETSNHIVELTRFLSRLQFKAYDDCFGCTRSELIRLGKRADTTIVDDGQALEYGSTQFKVNFSQLREVYQQSQWAKNNILIAVAGGEGDGTSGVRQAADATLRQEIEKFAHIIFASSAAQREFWLGQRTISIDQLIERYNGPKPCLHGSDAHGLNSVGQPDENRYCWIKGGLEFDSLRQACIDPENRAFVGSEPPLSATDSQVISKISLSNASWIQTPDIPLNPGLIAIIGARGSGKTALADIIAAGCDSIKDSLRSANQGNSPSFLTRAGTLVGDAEVTIKWCGGNESTKKLDGRNVDDHLAFPQVRYLSQQFVEELCSTQGISDGLIDEIERVILESHPLNEREGAINFEEFRDHRTIRFRQAREREESALSNISDRISIELEKEKLLHTFSTQVKQKEEIIKNYNSDLAKLAIQGTPEQVKRHEQLTNASQFLRNKIQVFNNKRRTFMAMQDEVASTRATKTPELLRETQERHNQSGLSADQWNDFLLIYKGDVDKSLSNYLTWANKNIDELSGNPGIVTASDTPLIADDADLNKLDLTTITAEMKRLEAVFSSDKLIRDKYSALTKRIDLENSNLKNLIEKLNDATGASERRKALQSEREEVYKRIFEAIINEQSTLVELYSPLMDRIRKTSGTLTKLSFTVRRIVDINKWGNYAEKNLLDLRKTGPFSGRGSLINLANTELKPYWETGSASEIQTAISSFIAKYQKSIFEHAPYLPSQQTEYKNWLKQFAHWLYGTDHILIQYEILYDGVDIQKLSPGTRGIVLLLLYLALDESDDRPLIIDQPEENLDPKSVNEELVPLFISSKFKRQVIIVTHNANLVINTDADQIIIAEAGPHQIGSLPPITYRGGGLENTLIRKAVCDILEGGEFAFRERARRLRVHIHR